MSRAATLTRRGSTPPVNYGAAPGLMGRDGSSPTDLTGLATYYIDSVNGLDTNNGTSTATPWKTLAKLGTSGTLTSDSVVALKCGSVFRESVPQNWSGTAGHPVVFGSYGTGTLPKIKGSKDYSALSWSVSSGSIYQAAATAMPASNVCYIDEQTGLRKMASLAAVVAPGQYFPDTTNNILYIWMWDSSSPAGHQIDLNGVTSTLCNTGSRHDLTFQDIIFLHGSGGNSGLFSASALGVGITVQRVESGPHQGVAIFVGSPGMIVQDCYTHDCWDWIEYPSSSAAGSSITISTVNSTGAVVRRNRVTRNYYGIRTLSSATNVDIHHNLVYLNHVNGIDQNGATSNIRVYNNTIHHRPTSTSGHGIDQQGGDGLLSKNNLLYSDFTGTNVNTEMFCLVGGTSANTSEDYCLGYLTPSCTAAFGKVGATQYTTAATYYAATVSAYGAGNNTHSINGSDPLFVNVAAGDYRLRNGSPAVNAGVVISGITDGYNGAAPDVGCYEHV